jgi:hypothetical protein
MSLGFNPEVEADECDATDPSVKVSDALQNEAKNKAPHNV